MAVDYYYYERNGDCGSKTIGGYGIISVSFKPQDNIFKIKVIFIILLNII